KPQQAPLPAIDNPAHFNLTAATTTTTITMTTNEKILQSLNYFAWKLGKPCSKLVILKLLYLADRWHLRKYGRTVSGDEYYAMKLGPVASRTKLLIEKNFNGIPDAQTFVSVEKKSRHEEIRSVAKPDLDWLSETDRMALDAAIEVLKKCGEYEIVNFVHLFPEWKKQEPKLNAGAKRAKMDFKDFFLPCPQSDSEYCDANAELVEINKDSFLNGEW
ncbi:MAG: SocA family protein, partial [Porphyromonadaceae bacterium]|nr:SocA family protein [Porphyromonadaceae bacterium]